MIYNANQMTGFCTECNIEVKCVKIIGKIFHLDKIFYGIYIEIVDCMSRGHERRNFKSVGIFSSMVNLSFLK